MTPNDFVSPIGIVRASHPFRPFLTEAVSSWYVDLNFLGGWSNVTHNQNDLDVVFDVVPVGPHRCLEQGARLDKPEGGCFGPALVRSEHDGFVWLTNAMKKISRFWYQVNTAFFNQVDVTVIIYPNNDPPAHFQADGSRCHHNHHQSFFIPCRI
jgi:hypothetical protein